MSETVNCELQDVADCKPHALRKTVEQRSKAKQKKKTVGGRILFAFSSNLTDILCLTIICAGSHSARSKLRHVVFDLLNNKKGEKEKSRLICTKAEEGLPTSDFRLRTSDFGLPTSDF